MLCPRLKHVRLASLAWCIVYVSIVFSRCAACHSARVDRSGDSIQSGATLKLVMGVGIAALVAVSINLRVDMAGSGTLLGHHPLSVSQGPRASTTSQFVIVDVLLYLLLFYMSPNSNLFMIFIH